MADNNWLVSAKDVDFYAAQHFSFDIYKAVNCAVRYVPRVDAVEVVRCKDCKYFRKGKPFRHECRKVSGGMFYPELDDFCSYGERRNNK